MQCWECEQPARAMCSFCGRFVCKDHASTMPTFVAMFLGDNTRADPDARTVLSKEKIYVWYI